MVIRGTAMVFSIALVGLTISGCTFFQRPADPDISIRDADGLFEISVCRDIAVETIAMSERSGRSPWDRFWTVNNASLELENGDILSQESLVPLASGAHEPTLAPGNQLNLLLKAETDDAISGGFFIPESGLAGSDWLHTDGSTSAKPCD